jgi:fatty-acyl-CoA synthase
LRFTWKAFNKRVDEAALGLCHWSQKGDHVGIWAQNVPEWLTYMYACAKIWGCLCNCQHQLQAAELELLVGTSDMHTLCITDGTWIPLCSNGVRDVARIERLPKGH